MIEIELMFSFSVLGVLAVSLVFAATQPGQCNLATEVKAVFQAKCAECHGPQVRKPEGKFGYVLDLKRLAADPKKVVPYKPEESKLWQLVRDDEMPPEEAEAGPLTKEQKQIIHDWITAGAPSTPIEKDAPSPPNKVAESVPTPTTEKHLLDWLGNLHVVVVHFPIALLLAAAAGELWFACWRVRQPAPAVRFCVLLGAVSAIVAAVLGWLHAASGYGVGSPLILAWHRWLGTASGAGSVILAVFSEIDSRRGVRNWWFRLLLLLVALLVAVAGHFDELPSDDQAVLRNRLKEFIRANTYDEATGTLTLHPLRAEAFGSNAAHYAEVFAKGRPEYAIPAGALTDPERQYALNAFFFWTAWACGTNRPDLAISYTQNWPHEPLIDNKPTADAVIWSILSFVLLLAGIGGMIWYFGSLPRNGEGEAEVPHHDPLLGYRPTPSQKATLKYFYVAAALLLLQIGLGAVTAHYGVEGAGFYGIPLDQLLPYSVTRTWHTQLGIFWIATAWLATGLFMAPAVGGHEPKGQRFLVNVLFGALVTIVLGSLAGEWLSVQQKLHGDAWFWFGHQGYEYVDLGRFWQLFLLAGLFIWLALMTRGLWPALRRPGEHRSLLALFLISSLAIASFYGAGLGIWKHTHLAMAEYWRWWVVHLWVEDFFEVFATVVIAFLFSRLQLIRTSTATSASLFSTSVFLAGGIIGTFHHLYFAGTPSVVMALGATFSALEVVPLVLIGFEAWENIRLTRLREWVGGYRWAIYFSELAPSGSLAPEAETVSVA